MLSSNGHLSFINHFLHKWHNLSSTTSGLKDTKIELQIPWFYPKNLCFQIIKLRLFYPPHYISNSSSQVDDFSGLIGSISHDDLYSLDYLNSLLELKNTKNASDLDTEWFSWPQPPGQPPFVGLIIENPILLWYLATSLLEAVEASLCHFYEI